MPVTPREPLQWLSLFRQQMDEIFRYLSILEGREGFTEQENAPLVDIYETSDSFVVEAELPGCRREDISLSICCSTLVVEGTPRGETEPGVNFICLERPTGRYCRAIEIPPAANLNEAKARYKSGVLTVVFPWCSKDKSHIRKIPIE